MAVGVIGVVQRERGMDFADVVVVAAAVVVVVVGVAGIVGTVAVVVAVFSKKNKISKKEQRRRERDGEEGVINLLLLKRRWLLGIAVWLLLLLLELHGTGLLLGVDRRSRRLERGEDGLLAWESVVFSCIRVSL